MFMSTYLLFLSWKCMEYLLLDVMQKCPKNHVFSGSIHFPQLSRVTIIVYTNQIEFIVNVLLPWIWRQYLIIFVKKWKHNKQSTCRSEAISVKFLPWSKQFPTKIVDYTWFDYLFRMRVLSCEKRDNDSIVGWFISSHKISFWKHKISSVLVSLK